MMLPIAAPWFMITMWDWLTSCTCFLSESPSANTTLQDVHASNLTADVVTRVVNTKQSIENIYCDSCKMYMYPT